MSEVVEYDDDFNIDLYLANKRRNYELFEKIVGGNPLEQIDWIIENGLDKFTYWYRCYETGSIYSPATVEPYRKRNVGMEMGYVRGGIGNKKLASWSYAYIED